MPKAASASSICSMRGAPRASDDTGARRGGDNAVTAPASPILTFPIPHSELNAPLIGRCSIRFGDL